MKVQDVRQAPVGLIMPGSAEDKRGGQDTQREFRRHMNELNSAEYEDHLRVLKGKIDEQGEIVARKMDLKELERYRRLVAEMLNETTSNAFVYMKMERYDIHGRHKTFSIIKRVNQKLDEMAQEVLREQTDNIRLLNMADEIRGLLVDLLL